MTDNDTSTCHVNLDHVAVVLHKPKAPENIGAVARAMKNMGLSRLILVAPVTPDRDRMLKMATAGATDLIENLTIYSDLEEALAPFQFVAGTTARTGGLRRGIITPRELARQCLSLSRRNRIALLFGPENWGLTNTEIRLCHTLVTIPTADLHSLNLAQAVLVLAYELFQAHRDAPPAFVPRLANSWELETMYAQLRDTLLRINYINHQNPEHWMMSVRRFFNRHGLRASEVQVIKGICRQIAWYVRHGGDNPPPPSP